MQVTSFKHHHNPGHTWRFDYPAHAILITLEDGTELGIYQDTQDSEGGEWTLNVREPGQEWVKTTMLHPDNMEFDRDFWMLTLVGQEP
jgi:hypothetical protein